MDESKCKSLKSELAEQEEPQIVSIERFFAGNDDAASIGCNLVDHPGIDLFRSVLTGLLKRSDVNAVYAKIAELDPGPDCWPFTDTVIVIGSIRSEDLQKALSPLHPTDVGLDRSFKKLALSHGGQSLVAWWD